MDVPGPQVLPGRGKAIELKVFKSQCPFIIFFFPMLGSFSMPGEHSEILKSYYSPLA